MDRKKAARSPIGKKPRAGASSMAERESAAGPANRPTCEKCGLLHEGCNAHTKHGPNAGKPCGMKPRIGSLVCVKHGGNHPDHKRKAKERLLELVDPALAALHKVLTDKNADDSTKVRAALGILDRTGHGPGAKLEVGVSKWDHLMEAASAEQFDRGAIEYDEPSGLPSGGGGGHEPTWEDVAQAQSNARAEAWREYDSEDAAEYERRPNFRHSQTVRGEATVVEDSILPGIPPTSGPSEYGGDPLAWPYDRPPAS
ncbi:hypothetical protein [Nocardioides humi]|uniref:Uncharacterized protein n=1 Tax=Nocardioides humi TaxID=449461 RepID=A0ABN2BQ52_9ACTN|nr:hypothetical protein [Nocardioides humi]